MISDQTIADVRKVFWGQALPVSTSPVLFSMAGIPASGKSTFVDLQIERGKFPSNAFIFDPDRVMNALPEYIQDRESNGTEVAFKRWEMDARELAYDMFETALVERKSIIKDMGCARQENVDMLRRAKDQGYKINFFYIYCPSNVAIHRSSLRDRFTPEVMIYERDDAIRGLLPQLAKISDSFTVIDNSDFRNPFQPMSRAALRRAGLAL